jgi:hypothetical protein
MPQLNSAAPLDFYINSNALLITAIAVIVKNFTSVTMFLIRYEGSSKEPG